MEASLQQDEQSQNNNIKGCILPWIHLHGDIRGDYALCCHTDSYKEPRRSGYVGDSPLQVWNNDYMKKARIGFLQGNYPPECSVCYDKESVGVLSHRQIVNKDYARYKVLQDKTNNDGSIKNPPIYLDIRFGNTCNFRCRMCGTDASTSWFKERHLGFGSKSDKPFIDEWTSNESFWKDFDEIIPFIEVMYFAGGEPFVQEGHYIALQKLIAAGKTDVSLQYNTNLSYKKFKDYDIKNMWNSFRSIQLWPSLDGVGAQAEYSRKGLSWDTFTDNLEYFKEFVTTVSTVSNIYSILSIPDMIVFLKNRGINFYITNLTSPSILSSTVLPKEAKQIVLKKFKKLINSNILNDSELQNIKGILSYLVSRDDSKLLGDFKIYNSNLDKSRNESFEEVFPEYKEWYTNI